jgi:hypothetical protein
VGPCAQPPLIPRSTRTLWIALGTAVISGAVGMTYMSTRPAQEGPAETAQSTPAKTQITDPVAAQPTASSNEPMRAANAPALTPTLATKPPPSMSGAGALPRRETSKPSTRAARQPPVEPAQSKPAVTASSRGPMPEAQEVLPPTSAPAGARSLQIPLNLIDHALWGSERWRDAAEPERIARFLVDDIRILTLQMYAEDLGNGVARFGVRGNLTNSSLEERVVTLRIDLVNGSDTSVSIPLEVEVDEQEEEEFDHELQMAAGNIRTSPATRVRITLSSKVPE